MSNDQKQPIDRLIEATRIRGSSRMIADGARADSVSRETADAVIKAVLAYCSQNAITRGDVAKSIGVAASTLGQVLNWNYPGNWREIVIDLDRWLEDQQKRDAAPRVSDFVWTGVAEEIHTVAKTAMMLRTIGLVFGPNTSGVGKTMALNAIAQSTPGAAMVTIEKVDATAPALLATIARALRVGALHQSARTYHSIKSTLAGSNRLLIIDQIHNLCGAADDRPFYVLADLFDATGAPQLWCGTSDVVAYLERGQAKGQEPLAQIRRRIGIARDLMERTRGGDGGPGEPLYSIEEIRRVFGKGKMRLAPDAAKYLWMMANLPDCGALGSAGNLVVMATTIYAARADVLTGDMLRQAHKLLVSRQAFDLIDSQMKGSEPIRPAKVG